MVYEVLCQRPGSKVLEDADDAGRASLVVRRRAADTKTIIGSDWEGPMVSGPREHARTRGALGSLGSRDSLGMADFGCTVIDIVTSKVLFIQISINKVMLSADPQAFVWLTKFCWTITVACRCDCSNKYSI